jgi:hypothetical protein
VVKVLEDCDILLEGSKEVLGRLEFCCAVGVDDILLATGSGLHRQGSFSCGGWGVGSGWWESEVEKRDLQSKPGSKALRESVTDRPGGQKRPEVNQAVLSAVVNIFRG